MPYNLTSTQFFYLASIVSWFWSNSVLYQLGWLITDLSISLGWLCQQGTGSILLQVVLIYVRTAAQKVASITNTTLPYLSWKSGVCFWWLCLAIVCSVLRTWKWLSAFLAKGNIVQVRTELQQLQLLVCFNSKSSTLAKIRDCIFIFIVPAKYLEIVDTDTHV